jgi:alpha-tubulin suppressor-like RCC1 family protein
MTNPDAALRSDGTVWTWGINVSGQLGIGTHSGPQECKPFSCFAAVGCSTKPVEVAGPGGQGVLNHVVAVAGGADLGQLQNVVSIAAGGGFSMARLADGSIWTWGENSSGQLGIGNATGPSVCTSEHTPCSLVPVQVKGAGGAGKFSGSVAISAGQEHAAALRAP